MEIVKVLEIEKVNEFEGKADSRGVKEKVRFANLRCDGFTVNVRVPFGVECPEGFSAIAMLETNPVCLADRYGKFHTYFLPVSLAKLKLGEKVQKSDLLSDFLSTSKK